MAKQVWGRHTKHLTTDQDNTKEISTNEWNDNINRKGHLGFDPITIASGSTVTPPAFSTTVADQPSSFIKLSGSTSVDTIAVTNTSEGDLLYIITTGSVTLNDNSTNSGNIHLLSNDNKDLETNVPTILIQSGTSWYEYGGSPVSNSSITFAKIQDIATMKVIGRTASGSGVSSEVTILDSDTMSGASDSTLATSESIKAYVDSQDHNLSDCEVTNAKLADMAANTIKVRNANSSGVPSDIALATTQILIGDGTGFTAASLSGDVTMANTGAVTVGTLNQSTTGNAATATTSTNVTVTDESTDTSCNVLFTTAATGDLPPKSGTNLTFNSNTGILTASGFEGDITGDVTGDVSGTAATVTGGTQANITNTENLVETGALNAGSITSGFGSINNGSSTITTTGAVSTGTLTATQVDITAEGDLRLQDASGGQYVGFEAPATVSASYTLEMPSATGASGKVLKMSSSANVLEWGDAGGAAGNTIDTLLRDEADSDPSYTSRTENSASTPIQIWSKTLDSNNENLYVRVKKNGSYTNVQIA